MSTHPIDIVIPWVDGSDPVWQADHAKYRASKSADNHPARYREWGLFRYWFRGIEQNAPWVRKVHLLTYGHLPAWLEPDHPKLHIVNHRDFIPEEYLPTFSSHTIELNMHRIPDLAEHFLYFNDDVYLMKPSQPEDFFRDDLPCACRISCSSICNVWLVFSLIAGSTSCAMPSPASIRPYPAPWVWPFGPYPSTFGKI